MMNIERNMRSNWKFNFLPQEKTIDFIGMEKSNYLGPSIKTMVECQQDVKYHMEGNVWNHTKMALLYLINMPEYEKLDQEEKSIIFLATLLHDVGKPLTTKEDEEGITSKGHSHKGARITRELLIKWNSEGIMPIPFHIRESICNLILLHMLPVYIFEKENSLFSLAAASYTTNSKLLSILAMADINGRSCSRQAIDLVKERIELFILFCEENNCYTQPRQFKTERSRFRYFFEQKGHPDYDYFEPINGEVIIMCGLQASGKDYVIKNKYSHLPVVSLDQTRTDMDLDYGDDEPKVLQEAKEKCRELMREHKNFVFNATNIVKDIRTRWIRLFRQYKYRIIIYYKERPLQVMLDANKKRENPVPQDIILEKVKKIDIPTWLECHELIIDVN